MVKFEVRPFATLKGTDKDDIRTGVEARFNHNDLHLKVRADDSSLRGDGNGIVLSASRRDNFEFVYDVGNNGPAFTFHSRANISDKDVALKYRNEVKGKEHYLEGTVQLDDKNTATVGWNLHGYEQPNYNQLNVKWSYRHDDKWTVEPSYCFGREAFAAKVIHQLDGENQLAATYDAHANTGELEWTNSNIGGPGQLKVSAVSSLSEDGLKSMPTIKAEKTFDLDL